MRKCKNCEYSTCGEPDSLSDWCDECRNDPDTGWGGFTDHSVGEHFMTETERQEYYEKHVHNESPKITTIKINY